MNNIIDTKIDTAQDIIIEIKNDIFAASKRSNLKFSQLVYSDPLEYSMITADLKLKLLSNIFLNLNLSLQKSGKQISVVCNLNNFLSFLLS